MSTEKEDFLNEDPEVTGQKFVLLSFLSPEKVLTKKDLFLFEKFLHTFEFNFRVTSFESFLLNTLKGINDKLTEESDKAEAQDLSGVAQIIRNSRVRMDTVMDNLKTYMKENQAELVASKLKEKYEDFISSNRDKLEEEFFSKNEFRSSIRGLKVRGVYDTAAEAGARAKTLQKLDPFFNVYVGQMGFWLPWDPEPADVADQEYAEDQLNTLMKNYKQNESQKEALYEEQKRERMAGSKVAVPKFGPGSKEENALPTDMFGGGGEADLAIARKKELAAAKVTLNV